MNTIVELYKLTYGVFPKHIEPLPKSGSNRQYFRLYDDTGKTIIGVTNNNVKENKSFIYLAQHFNAKNLPMPRIKAVNSSYTAYLQDDLGVLSLYKVLSPARFNKFNYSSSDFELLKKVIRLLPHIQIEGSKDLDYQRCISPIVFNQQAAMFDLNYFKYNFFKTTNIAFDENELEQDLLAFAKSLVGNDEHDYGFLYRDFQSRNIIIKNENPYFIDFQAGMYGPIQYDLASFLWQASANYSQDVRNQLINEYLDEIHLLLPDFNETSFRERLRLFVLFRIMQVLGAYGLRGYVERKSYFINSIPNAIQNLKGQLKIGTANKFPYLEKLLMQMVSLPKFSSRISDSLLAFEPQNSQNSKLLVRVISFSYKKGIPNDDFGNGGGYVFDCRSIHNPGRYEPYKLMTGLDTPVIQFLEKDGEILSFLNAVYTLADTHVQRYIERGFSNLMFSFGCTGGQHRSVYSAQHLAEHLNEKFGIEVQLFHREQHIKQSFSAK